MRLLRLDPAGRSVAVLARERRIAWLTRYALTSDPGGKLYLAASRDDGPHLVVRLDVTGDLLRATGITVGRGAVVPDQAHGSEWGVSVGTVVGRDRPNVVGYHERDFLRAGEREWRARCF